MESLEISKLTDKDSLAEYLLIASVLNLTFDNLAITVLKLPFTKKGSGN